ncbi:MAG: OPT/YSL family transporter [Eggerthellales bacterium]|nr:OPT/YSL family transporter [Eggerthellales bacterium]
MNDIKGQLTLRGILIGCVGCVIITAASIYTALKMGALPWPIIFAALISLFFLKAFGSRSLNEANVTHTIMSAGAMVAGGLAFTIPGIWILGLGEASFVHMLLIALAGVALGLVACAFLRTQFVEEQQLEFPIGQAAAETLKAGDKGGKVGLQLFGAMGFAGVFAALRDLVGVVPAMVLNTINVPGVIFGIYLSPMMLSVGFLVGAGAMLTWAIGGIIQVVIVTGGSSAGLYDVAFGQAFNSSLGMGLMMGCGIAVVLKDVLPKGCKALAAWSRSRKASATAAAAPNSAAAGTTGSHAAAKSKTGIIALVVAAVALAICMMLGIGPVASIIVVLLSFVTVAMSAQSVGQTGIDPMEIFGLIVLLFVAAISDTPQMQLFFVAAIIAVACGLGGDVMNDFKAGHVLGTSPKAQVIGQAIGGLVGAGIAAVVMYTLITAYGADAFGPGKDFVAAQASVVATMISGIPNIGAFVAGLVIGIILYWMGLPAMMVGLGVYLPFYMTLSAFLGCIVKLVYDAVVRNRDKSLSEEERAAKKEKADQTGLVVASGLLGGESIVGVIVAIAMAAPMLF